MASSYGQLKTVELLLEKKADIEARTNEGSTPLIVASYAGRVEVMKLLKTAGACLDYVNKVRKML